MPQYLSLNVDCPVYELLAALGFFNSSCQGTPAPPVKAAVNNSEKGQVGLGIPEVHVLPHSQSA